MNRYTGRTLALEIIMLGVAAVFFVPLYILVNMSLKRTNDQSSPLTPVTDITFQNYVDAWQQASLGQALLTSAFVTIVSVVLIVVVSALAGSSFRPPSEASSITTGMSGPMMLVTNEMTNHTHRM